MKGYNYSEGFVVDLNEKIFYYLGKLSVFTLVRKIYFRSIEKSYLRKNSYLKSKRDYRMDQDDDFIKYRSEKSYAFVDIWVMGNLITSIILSYILITFNIENRIVLFFSSAYAIARVFEVIIYQINVNLFDVYRAKKKNKDYKIKSPTRTVTLLLHNYIELVFWYLIIVVAAIKLSDYNGSLVRNWNYCAAQSFKCITSLDLDSILNISFNKESKMTGLLFRIATIEVISGLIMTIISLANFIGRLPAENLSEEIKENKKSSR